jgi:hypothetical protein
MTQRKIELAPCGDLLSFDPLPRVQPGVIRIGPYSGPFGGSEDFLLASLLNTALFVLFILLCIRCIYSLAYLAGFIRKFSYSFFYKGMLHVRLFNLKCTNLRGLSSGPWKGPILITPGTTRGFGLKPKQVPERGQLQTPANADFFKNKAAEPSGNPHSSDPGFTILINMQKHQQKIQPLKISQK